MPAMFISIYFMWDVRHPKTAVSTMRAPLKSENRLFIYDRFVLATDVRHCYAERQLLTQNGRFIVASLFALRLPRHGDEFRLETY